MKYVNLKYDVKNWEPLVLYFFRVFLYALFRSFNGAYLDFTIQSFKCPGGLRLRTGLSTTGPGGFT